MKKFIVIALALFLAIPAISFAGSATSRWDITIGGYVKFDMGWANQGQGADYGPAQREGYGALENLFDEYGNFFSAGGETRLNFLVKGPDGWGAKTMAFIEGDFRGSTAGSGYGAFALRHAFMKFMWENDALTIGHTWQKWGLLPTFANALLSFNGLGAFLKGSRQPQIMWDHSFNKNWKMSLGVISPTNSLATSGGETRVDNFTRSYLPFVEGEFMYTSDACGKIGPWQMLFSLSGFFGWDRQTFATVPVTGTTTSALKWDDDMEQAWGAAFKAFIPIIPEKKGNKAGALAVSGILFASQNPSWYFGGPYGVGTGAINTAATGLEPDYSFNRFTGGWGQISYWFTDSLFINGWYGMLNAKQSHRFKSNPANANIINRENQIIVNMSYDVNPAIRLGVEYDYISTRYANYGAPVGDGTLFLDRKGQTHAFRIGAWYFF